MHQLPATGSLALPPVNYPQSLRWTTVLHASYFYTLSAFAQSSSLLLLVHSSKSSEIQLNCCDTAVSTLSSSNWVSCPPTLPCITILSSTIVFPPYLLSEKKKQEAQLYLYFNYNYRKYIYEKGMEYIKMLEIIDSLAFKLLTIP